MDSQIYDYFRKRIDYGTHLKNGTHLLFAFSPKCINLLECVNDVNDVCKAYVCKWGIIQICTLLNNKENPIERNNK